MSPLLRLHIVFGLVVIIWLFCFWQLKQRKDMSVFSGRAVTDILAPVRHLRRLFLSVFCKIAFAVRLVLYRGVLGLDIHRFGGRRGCLTCIKQITQVAKQLESEEFFTHPPHHQWDVFLITSRNTYVSLCRGVISSHLFRRWCGQAFL